MFYLSKIVWAFFQPSSIIAILLAAGLLLETRRKRAGLPLLFSAAALYLIAGYSPLANWLVMPLEESAQSGSEEKIDGAAGIIVLGGALPGMLNSGRVVVNDAADRMIEALRVAQQHPELPVIFSGGIGNLFKSPGHDTEAELARRFFEGFGIAPPRLKLEDRSRNTLENAVFTAETPAAPARSAMGARHLRLSHAKGESAFRGAGVPHHPAGGRLPDQRP